MKCVVAFVLAFIVLPGFAEADESPSLLFSGGIQSLIWNRDDFYIDYSDQVTDGCLPQPSRMKDSMELVLRQNGFSISSEDSPFKNKIFITALGYGAGSGSCLVTVRAKLLFVANVSVPFSKTLQDESHTFITIPYEFGDVVLSGNKSSMQRRVETSIKEFGENLYLDVSRSKDEISEKFPDIVRHYNSQPEN